MRLGGKINSFSKSTLQFSLFLYIFISGCSQIIFEPTEFMSSNSSSTPVVERMKKETGDASVDVVLTSTMPIIDGSKFLTTISPKDEMTMVFVPNGEFLMGSVNGEGDSDEEPQHSVFLDSYWIDQFEITNAMYANCVNAGVCSLPVSLASYSISHYFGNPEYEDFPVVNVTWYQARKYCQWVERSLPSEAQWEKAARGNNGAKYPWGNTDPNEKLANYSEIKNDLSRVGCFPQGASPYGAMDMAGNAAEWVEDFYGEYPTTTYTFANPLGPETGSYRILRGGSWIIGPYLIRSSERFWASPFYADYDSGFRCALAQQSNQ
ncbi:MAG: formylglycine-generating enzyme family protein [Anaerolinea sp.]|nr:formylglycine-generating enzyme family protein [Anaerolinea sp.]